LCAFGAVASQLASLSLQLGELLRNPIHFVMSEHRKAVGYLRVSVVLLFASRHRVLLSASATTKAPNSSRGFAPQHSCNRARNEQYQEHEKQYLCNARYSAGYPGKTKHSGDQRQNQEQECPKKHVPTSSRSFEEWLQNPCQE
jgi:hypothetical protein